MDDYSVQLLKQLTEAHGTSGSEHAVRQIVANELGSDSVDCDKLGNIFADMPGTTPGPRIMIESHMDEVGFMVRLITPEGFIKFATLGGWWGHTLLAQRVRILTRSGSEILGLIASKPPHFLGEDERNRVIKPDAMFVDVGASSAAQVAEFGIAIGDTIVPDSTFTPMANPDLLLAKAFDNRVGVSLMIEAAKALRDSPRANTIIAVGSVQEEVGTRGIKTAAEAVNPDVAIILEGTPADDAPGSPAAESQGAMGKGPQLRLMDPTAIMNRPLANWIIDLADEQDIPLQVAIRTSGGTDAKIAHLHGTGVPTVVIGVPARYIHTHNSMIRLSDYQQTVKLITQIGRRLDTKTVASFTNYL